MTDQDKALLGKTLWNIANALRGGMNADDFRDYMLSFLFLRYLSSQYEDSAKALLGKELLVYTEKYNGAGLKIWADEHPKELEILEKELRRKLHYVIAPKYLWNHLAELARTQNRDLLETLLEAFKYIQGKSFQDVEGEEAFKGLFSEINLSSEKLGKTYEDRNEKLCEILTEIEKGIKKFSTQSDSLGDAYEYLIGQFAAGGGKKAGEFYTPQTVSDILSRIVTLDGQNPSRGEQRQDLKNILDFACGSGSLLLNILKRMRREGREVGLLCGQEKNITTYNLARMNMLLHGVRPSDFEIFHGDTLLNQWDKFQISYGTEKPSFDAVVANPPFSLRWKADEKFSEDFRFKNYGLAPKSAADFAFLLHGFNFLSDKGTMAIILPHGVLFRGGAEGRIRKKLLEDHAVDTVIGLPANLFFSTGIPVCVLILKKCCPQQDVLFINASGEGNFKKVKNQNILEPEHVDKIVQTYAHRTEEEYYSRRVSLDEIKENDFNLNISRYVSTTKPEPEIDLEEVTKNLQEIEEKCQTASSKFNVFLQELGLEAF